MFFQGKVQDARRTAKPAKKRHSRAYYIIGVFSFAIEAMLGLNAAFLADQSLVLVCDHMLGGTPFALLAPLIALTVSLAVGAAFIMAGMWTYNGFIQTLETARAYRRYYGSSSWPLLGVWSLLLCVLGLDLTTLGFRAAYFSAKGETALLGFFLILCFVPLVLGAILHVLEHAPVNHRLAQLRHYAQELQADEVESSIRSMDADLRDRLLSGDSTAMDEHRQRVAAIQEENAALEQRRMQESRSRQEEYNRPLFNAS